MTGEKLHLFLLNYLPVLGFAVYAVMTGFDNELFFPLLITGWIVVVVYQAILTAVYTPPTTISVGILSLLLPPFLLLITAFFQALDYAVVFIEMSAVDMLGISIGLIFGICYKGFKDGLKDAPVFALVFTIGLFLVASYFLVRLFLRFFEVQEFDPVSIVLVSLAVLRSGIFFSVRIAGRVVMMRSPKESIPKREFSVAGILITIGIWLLVVPGLVAIFNLIPRQ